MKLLQVILLFGSLAFVVSDARIGHMEPCVIMTVSEAEDGCNKCFCLDGFRKACTKMSCSSDGGLRPLRPYFPGK
ncbi:hypothetical protein SK128_026893 [Halocaridina rubra]|uniref:Uncharacterized protein n=1 Tax=Halocaridina rubra TaxID=373956 RepID=A0AAN8ZTG3_HALRR